jgi:dUTP pyrophosphatase
MSDIETLKKKLEIYYGKYMLLKIFVDSSDDDLIAKYHQASKNHNSKLLNNLDHIDAGFDLLAPQEQIIYPHAPCVQKIDYQIICAAKILNHATGDYVYNNTGFYMYPRSSISKSNIRLANNVGIIDAGYRGHLMGMFDVVYIDGCKTINKFDRHLQICAPGLIPIVVEMVGSKEELGEETARGNGGFGSTGL